MKYLMIFMLMLTTVGFAQEKKNKNAKRNIEVSGNCDMCKKRIEKAAFGVAGVKSAEWHSDDQLLHLIINEEKTSLEKVQQAVAKAGHDTRDIRASDADYQNLHGCCKYERRQ
ncbi:MAG TPA: metal transporter [Flavobacterium sp.]|nr:metal transporter [Flavobacterium sp.]